MDEEADSDTIIEVGQRARACPECGSTHIIVDYESAEVVCRSCGFVMDEKIADTRPEWRAFDEEQREKRARVGAPMTYALHDKGLSTMIDWQDNKVLGKRDNPSKQMELYKLRKWQRRIRVSDSIERNLAAALAEMTKMAEALNLPKNIVETSSILYRRAIKKRLIRGRSIHTMSAAAIYLSCRQCGIPRTLDEIAAASNVSKKEIGRSYRLILKELSTPVLPSMGGNYAARFSNKLAISGMAEAIAIKILEAARTIRLTSGRGPTGIAAAATYIATVLTNERKTQREVAEVANVTEVTIRNRYKELLERIYIEVYV
ncbi:MAG: transcription initiation factor IIB [Candidatus Bathyarchaeia archaeon]